MQNSCAVSLYRKILSLPTIFLGCLIYLYTGLFASSNHPKAILSEIHAEGKYELEQVWSSNSGTSKILECYFFLISPSDPLYRVVKLSQGPNKTTVIFYGEVGRTQSALGQNETPLPSHWTPIDSESSRLELKHFVDIVISDWQKKEFRKTQLNILKSIIIDSNSPWPYEDFELQDEMLNQIDAAELIESVVSPAFAGDNSLFIQFNVTKENPRPTGLLFFIDLHAEKVEFDVGSDLVKLDLKKEPYYKLRVIGLIQSYLSSQKSVAISAGVRKHLEEIVAQFGQ